MLKQLFFLLIVRPFILFVTGVYVKGYEHLPLEKPCIIAANHNSHLDTLILLSLFPNSQLKRVRPVAAADYFMKNKLTAWCSKNFIGIIPLKRKITATHSHPLAEVYQALEQGESIIIFPEGSRGEPEELAPFKKGIAHLAKDFPQIPIVPVCIRGAGKVLPKGEALLVPFGLDVNIASPLYYTDESCQAFVARLEEHVKALCQGE